MTEFDAEREVKTIAALLDASRYAAANNNSGTIGNRLLDEAQKEFCKLSPGEAQATINAMERYDDYDGSLRVLADGHDKKIGATYKARQHSAETFLSFDCPFANKK